MVKKRWLFLAALACFTVGMATACGETEAEPETGEYLRYEDFDGGLIAILKEGAKVANVEVPAEHEGKKVELISGFAYNTHVKTVSLPDTLLSLPKEAFRGCTSLTSLTVPDSVRTIGWGILRDCNAITSLTVPFLGDDDLAYATEDGTISYFFAEDYGSVPESLKTLVITKERQLRSDAFDECEKLESITLPATLTSIQNDAFKDCTSLNAVHISDVNAWLNISFGNLDSNPLTKAGNLYVNGTLATEITADVETLKYAVFAGCTSLQKLTLGENTAFIEDCALEGCTSLQYNVKDGVNYLGNPNTDYAWIMSVTDKSITSFTSDEATVGVGAYAFDGCNSLKTVTFGDSVKHFGNNVLGSAPVEILTSSDAPWLGEGIKTTLKKVTLTSALGLSSQFSDCIALEEVILPETMINLGQGSFSGCTALKSIVFPENFRTVGYGAFNGCTSLEYIEIKNPETTFNNDLPFYSCTNVKKIILPTMSEERFMLKNLFKNTCTIELVEIKGGNQIPDNACTDFTGLKKVIVPDSVTSIGLNAFKGCTQLTSFNITNGLRQIKKEAFAGCTNVTFELATTEGQWKLVKNNSGVYYFDSPEAVKGYLVTGSYVSQYNWTRYR